MLVRRFWPTRPMFGSGASELERLRQDMLRMLDAMEGGAPPAPGAGVFPPVNVSQDSDQFFISAAVPGIKADDLHVSALRNRVTIEGKREIPAEENGASHHRRERAEGLFSRVVTLPAEVDGDRVDAEYRDGILRLRLPKTESAKPRQIKVRT